MIYTAEIKVAKTAGFCFGVDRAVNKVNELLEAGQKVCTLGPLIHNPQFIKSLTEKGVVVAESPDDCPEGYTLVVRTHGITKETADRIKELSISFVDATCPYVSKIHKLAEKHYEKSAVIIVCGDSSHPEVKGIVSHCKDRSYVVSSESQIEDVISDIKKRFGEQFSDIVLLSQTTFSVEEFKKCVKKLKMLCTNPIIFDTICSATAERQAEAVSLAKTCDMMVVIGGRNSSNTQKLKDACEKYCPTYLVESYEELKNIDFGKAECIGVTAGASTPACNIKEVLKYMSDMVNDRDNLEALAAEEIAENSDYISEDEKLFAEALEKMDNDNFNPKVIGTVQRITPTEIHVDIEGRKQTGIVPVEEYSSDPNADPSKELKVGDQLELIIMKTNDVEGTIMLSKRRLDASKHWEAIVDAHKNGTVVTGKVVEVISKGVVAFSKGIRVFIPASLATASRKDRIEDLLDTEVEFIIIDIDKRRKRAVGSIKDVLRKKKAEAAEKFWATAKVGDVLKGTVKSLTSFAAFVDLGGVDGMIHKSELSWNRVGHPSEVVKEGDEVEVYIKALDSEKKKISLGYRKPEDNPWEILKKQYPVGTVLDVTITGLTTFGAFAQVMPGIEGLIHISQISNERIAKPQDVLSIGDQVKVMVTGIDAEKKRLSLSMSALLEPPAKEEAEEPEQDEPVAVSIDELLASAENKEAE
ncbi:MAG TPA: bifunctional 4-hydroxy-3-methylbut-2-enyl diphosphate reductase/30S ribosomal protein S1 [Clostridiales bacterium]|nr:bifunctional 4-hydroxy-3-methylbut-2-enyl diphosphate reductase/30S ribosomal protein S1 [Clostridiales bacterium]